MLKKFVHKIRNREGKFYSFIYDFLKRLMYFNILYIPVVHKFLRKERAARLGTWRWFLRVFYYIPLFKAGCFKCGGNLRLIDGLPYINDNIKLIVGDNVTIYGSAGFQGYKVVSKPVLEIGDNTFIGPGVRIGVGDRKSVV